MYVCMYTGTPNTICRVVSTESVFYCLAHTISYFENSVLSLHSLILLNAIVISQLPLRTKPD
jgi:hypothetical protein